MEPPVGERPTPFFNNKDIVNMTVETKKKSANEPVQGLSKSGINKDGPPVTKTLGLPDDYQPDVVEDDKSKS
jgi:hypothetical protein